MLRPLLVAVGGLSVALGTLGIFLPLLPTTPLLLLAAACFARSSDRFHHWLLHHPVLGRCIRDYMEHRGLSLRTKLVGIGALWASIGSTLVLVAMPAAAKLLLALIAVSVTVHLVRLRTL
jgi:uncharacterized membrane protein YbaN (DUF454 family)